MAIPKLGRNNTLWYTLILTVFLTINTVDWSYNKEKGWHFESKQPPTEIAFSCLILIGLGLGVNVIDAFRALTDLALAVRGNSAAIASITEKVENNTEEIKQIKPENSDNVQ